MSADVLERAKGLEQVLVEVVGGEHDDLGHVVDVVAAAAAVVFGRADITV
jgi:hypothetical protein